MNDMKMLNQNTALYGHNMGAGRDDMFGSLLAYKDYKYYSAHRYIQFDTIFEHHGWWKVFAVVGHDTRSDNFDYLQLEFPSEKEFTDWIEKVQALSLHGADMDITPDARVLVLSTCDRGLGYGRSGRLLIFAVKMNKEQKKWN